MPTTNVCSACVIYKWMPRVAYIAIYASPLEMRVVCSMHRKNCKCEMHHIVVVVDVRRAAARRRMCA